MKAIVYSKKQAQNKFQYCDVEPPLPGAKQILVKVYYCSINAADTRSLKMGIIPKSRIFGSALSGRVEGVGKQVSGFKVGDEVVADLSDFGFGALAEYALAPEKALILKPSSLSFESAAALPVAATTALKALRNKANIKEGDKVLIVGASGGVGSFAIQIAKYYGASVSAVCSTNNVAQSKALGANHVIDYNKENFLETKERFDLILAINGNYPLLAYRRILTTSGTFVMVGGDLAQIFKSLLFSRLLSFGSKKMRSLTAKADSKDLELVADWASKSIIKPNIIKQYPLKNSATAIDYLSQGHASGKVIIKVAENEKK